MTEDISLKEYVDLRFEEQERAVQAALSSAKEAVTKAEAASEKRFDAVNEFRATLADQQRTLMPRAEVEILNKSINDRLEKIENNAVLSQGKGLGLSQGIGWIVGISGLIIGIVGIMFKIFG